MMYNFCLGVWVFIAFNLQQWAILCIFAPNSFMHALHCVDIYIIFAVYLFTFNPKCWYLYHALIIFCIFSFLLPCLMMHLFHLCQTNMLHFTTRVSMSSDSTFHQQSNYSICLHDCLLWFSSALWLLLRTSQLRCITKLNIHPVNWFIVPAVPNHFDIQWCTSHNLYFGVYLQSLLIKKVLYFIYILFSS